MRPRSSLRLVLLALLWLLGPAWGLAASAPDTAARPLPRPALDDPEAAAGLFAMPLTAERIRAAAGLAQAGDPEGAAALLDAAIAAHPGVPDLHAARAALFMLAQAPDAALQALETAVPETGGLGPLLEAPIFASLAADPALKGRFAALRRTALPAPVPAPAPVTRTAPVTALNTAWNPETERLEPRFIFPDRPRSAVLPRAPRRPAYELLREHVRRGRAAGNHGDLYDNRDRGHSALSAEAHPQLARVIYSPAARAADVDYGLNDSILFPRVTLGNSSTAITAGGLWRSLPRLALTRADGTGPMRLWQNAQANHLYVHPAHKDFGPANGDLFPANTPYLLISRGSSGSDQPFLEAAAMILAAFRPETKARLARERLIVPTLQMVFRRSLQDIRSREAYFSGAAHPVAFDAAEINLARMVSLANSIAPSDIPPQVRIRVTEETLGVPGVDYFGDGLSEQLFDTPAAVARLWRSNAYTKSFTLTAEDTRDPNGRPLDFHWRLLQGDPDRVRITPLDDGRRARIEVDWHDPFRISEKTPLISARVDIGVFAANGVHDSAPAILSIAFPRHETRRYEPGPDGAPRPAAIDHAARPETYADPMLFPRADWRDAYRYDAAGRLAGWTRHREGERSDYTAQGMRILDRDATEVARAQRVVYPLHRTPKGSLALQEVPAGPTMAQETATP